MRTPLGAISGTTAAVAALCIGGCASTYHDGGFRDDHAAFRVPPPPSTWQQVSLPTANVAWHEPQLSSTLLINSLCDGNSDPPLAALTNELLMGTTERNIETQEVVQFSGREALDSRATAKLDGVLRRYAVFVVKKDGCIYDIVMSAPQSTFERALPVYDRVRSSLVIEPRPDHAR